MVSGAVRIATVTAAKTAAIATGSFSPLLVGAGVKDRLAATTLERAVLHPRTSAVPLEKQPIAVKWQLEKGGCCHCKHCLVDLERVQGSEQQLSLRQGGGGTDVREHMMHVQNTGGVKLPALFTCGTTGRAMDATRLRSCSRCGGIEFISTHPAAIRWQCVKCGWRSVQPVWRHNKEDALPPMSSFLWIEHAITRKWDKDRVAFCFDEIRVLLAPLQLAVVLRELSRNNGLVSETAISAASLHWCVSNLKTASGTQFGTHALGPKGLPAVVVVTSTGSWQIDDEGVEQHLVRCIQEAASTTTTVSVGRVLDQHALQLQAVMADPTAQQLQKWVTAGAEPKQEERVAVTPKRPRGSVFSGRPEEADKEGVTIATLDPSKRGDEEGNTRAEGSGVVQRPTGPLTLTVSKKQAGSNPHTLSLPDDQRPKGSVEQVGTPVGQVVSGVVQRPTGPLALTVSKKQAGSNPHTLALADDQRPQGSVGQAGTPVKQAVNRLEFETSTGGVDSSRVSKSASGFFRVTSAGQQSSPKRDRGADGAELLALELARRKLARDWRDGGKEEAELHLESVSEAAHRHQEQQRLQPSVGLDGDMVATGVLVDDLFGSQLVPLMLTVDNAGRAETAEQCRGSNKTRSQTPTTPMLIWHARVSMVSMLASPLSSVEAVWEASQCLTSSVNPFATVQYGASPLWDTAVSGAEWEATSVGTSFSVHTPMFSDASRVNQRTFGLNGEAISRILHWHPHASLICNGALYGFSLMSDGAVRRQDKGNTRLTAQEAEQITAWLEKQIASGKTVPIPEVEAASMVGLFVSSFTAAPKPGAPAGTIRTCHNLSAGGKQSVNAGIDFDPLNPIGLLQLDSVIARIQYLRALHPGRKIMASKCDMKEFFRQVPLRRRDMARMAQRWKDVLYTHEAFTFGSSSAPHICSIITNALCDEMARLGWYCQCFIDDCVLIAYEDEIHTAVKVLQALISEFGLVENVEKFVPPTQHLAIVGVQFDLESFTVGVAPEKRDKILLLLAALVKGKSTTVGELRTLAGKLAFLSTVIPFARCYTAFIWRAAGAATRPSEKLVPLNRNLRGAVRWWSEVLRGTRFTVTDLTLGSPEHPLLITSAITSDASSWGFAGVDTIHKLWMADWWRAGEVVDDAQINIRECFGSLCWVAALAETGVLSGTIVVFETDNECSVWGVNKGHSNKHVLNFMVVAMHVLQERYRFLLVMKHIPGVLNVLSDSLSRNKSFASLQLSTPQDWRELSVPSSVRSLLLTALTSSSSGHVMDVCSGTSRVWSTLESSVVSHMKSPSPAVASLSIPWIPYRDFIALT